MPDISIHDPAVDAAPKSYLIKGAEEIVLKGVTASFDGTGAAGSFIPAVQVVDPSGFVVGTYICGTTLAAGASADVSWFPGVGSTSEAPVAVGFASYNSTALGVADGVVTHFNWAWDATAGQEDMFDLTNPADPVARKDGIFNFSYTAEFHHAAVAGATFEMGLDLNSSLGMSGFAAGWFPAQNAGAGARFPFGNISCQAPLKAGDSVDSLIANHAGVAVDFFGFADFTRFPLKV